jgi:AcrR family transcriptional regulator
MNKTEQDIITAAITVFAADARAPMTAVAKAAGISRMTLCRYFPCRDRLIKKIDTYLIAQAVQCFDAAIAAHDEPLEQLHAFFDSRIERVQGHLVLMKLNDDFFDDHHPEASACAEINGKVMGLLASLRQRKEINGELTDAWIMFLLHSIVFGAWMAKKSGTVVPRDIPRLAWESFMRAIAPQKDVT